MSIFSNILSRKPQSSDFNLSHTRKFSFNAGKAIPTLCQEILPSDRWNYAMSALIRFMPMQAPVMHMVDVYNYSFFVPARLTMARGRFETFITGGKNGDGKDSLGNTIEIPYITMNFRADAASTAASINVFTVFQNVGANPDDGSLTDFLGIPVPAGQCQNDNVNTRRINMMPFIAFWRIWCQFFRDQNLHPDYEELYPGIFDAEGDITAAVYAALTASLPNKMAFFTVPNVCWEKDYFTSALPFAQRGNPVETPLSGNATVTYKDPAVLVGKTATTNAGAIRAGSLANAPLTFTEDTTGTNQPVGIDNIQEINLTTGGFTINALRLASRLQEWLEKMARGGARYIEQIRQQFGVTSSDARLQRPEFLGGGKIPVNISEVLQTSEDSTEVDGTPLATMAGHGVAAGNINNFSRFFEEHGFLISIMFLRPRTAYQQGIPRLYTQRFDKLNWAWPSFAHLGEQEVLEEELFFDNTPGTDAGEDQGTFGYQSRYSEYKYIPSTVHAEFKSSLAFWQWGRIFDERPTLSAGFVQSDPSDRIFNVIDPSVQKMYCIVNNKIKARRPLPYFSQPAL